MKVKVVSSSGRLIATLDDIKPTNTVEELKEELQIAKSINKYRQRLILQTQGEAAPVVLENNKKLHDYQLTTDFQVVFKDLGPQISWRTVFIIEYLGPLLIYPFFYLQPFFIYGGKSGRDFVQELAFYCFVFHYLKREYETIFVHRFGSDTMPLRNLFKNSGYYWINAIICAYFVNHPLYTPPPAVFVYTGLAMFIIGELGNLQAHYTLRNLRKPGTRERNIPRGGLFELVSCANYTFEIFAWIGWSTMAMSLAAYFFTVQGAVQMYFWAVAKHRRYRKEFPNYPKGRKALVPFLA